MSIARILAFAWFAVCSALAPAVDLTKIDRHIAKEPAYQTKTPKYCLLVFGPEAKTRIWLVLNGDTLYVDRNGNGDLTDDGEAIRATLKPWSWSIGALLEADGKTRHTDLSIEQRDNHSFLISMRIANGLHAEVGNEVGNLQFAGRQQNAPIVHIAGPLSVLFRSRHDGGRRSFVPGTTASFIALIGTPGLGEGASVYYHHNNFGELNIEGQVEFFGKDLRGPLLEVRIAPDGY